MTAPSPPPRPDTPPQDPAPFPRPPYRRPYRAADGWDHDYDHRPGTPEPVWPAVVGWLVLLVIAASAGIGVVVGAT